MYKSLPLRSSPRNGPRKGPPRGLGQRRRRRGGEALAGAKECRVPSPPPRRRKQGRPRPPSLGNPFSPGRGRGALLSSRRCWRPARLRIAETKTKGTREKQTCRPKLSLIWNKANPKQKMSLSSSQHRRPFYGVRLKYMRITRHANKQIGKKTYKTKHTNK